MVMNMQTGIDGWLHVGPPHCMHLCACAEHAFGSMHDDETYLKMMQ